MADAHVDEGNVKPPRNGASSPLFVAENDAVAAVGAMKVSNNDEDVVLMKVARNAAGQDGPDALLANLVSQLVSEPLPASGRGMITGNAGQQQSRSGSWTLSRSTTATGTTEAAQEALSRDSQGGLSASPTASTAGQAGEGQATAAEAEAAKSDGVSATRPLAVSAQRLAETVERDDLTGTATALRLFVGRLGSHTSADRLRDYFLCHMEARGVPHAMASSAILDVYMPHDPRGASRGFAFVSFADKALLDMVLMTGPGPQGSHIIDGRTVVLDVAAPRGLKVDQPGRLDTAGRSTTAVLLPTPGQEAAAGPVAGAPRPMGRHEPQGPGMRHQGTRTWQEGRGDRGDRGRGGYGGGFGRGGPGREGGREPEAYGPFNGRRGGRDDRRGQRDKEPAKDTYSSRLLSGVPQVAQAAPAGSRPAPAHAFAAAPEGAAYGYPMHHMGMPVGFGYPYAMPHGMGPGGAVPGSDPKDPSALAAAMSRMSLPTGYAHFAAAGHDMAAAAAAYPAAIDPRLMAPGLMMAPRHLVPAYAAHPYAHAYAQAQPQVQPVPGQAAAAIAAQSQSHAAMDMYQGRADPTAAQVGQSRPW